jgi:hypothetical protein
MMIWTWYKYFPDLAKKAIQLFVLDPKEVDESNASQEPYGSWKDIKYLCKYGIDFVVGAIGLSHPLIHFCISLTNNVILNDYAAYMSSILDNNANPRLSLASKWVPREVSKKFGFLYEAFATEYFQSVYMCTAKTEHSKKKAVVKCKAQYRELCSKLNRCLDTVQIKQTGGHWAEINHSKTTSITMAKQRRAFMNLKKGGGRGGCDEVRSQNPDRIQCAKNFQVYLESLKKSGKEVKGKNVGLEAFTKQAFDIYGYDYKVRNQEEADILNSQWRDNCNKKNGNGLGPMIAIVDTSGSMEGDPINAAIALGCRVAEKSILGKRVMTFSSEPAWINMDGCDTFTDMVSAIMRQRHSAGMNTNFYKALDMILCAIEEKRIPPAEVENMILAIFSDMQIDDNLHMMNTTNNNNCFGYNPNDRQKMEARGKWATMFLQIKQKYAEVGMRMYGVPLNPPHILFWNLRKTDGFPTLSTEAGCSMMSGYDPSILNMFCELGMEALKEMSAYKMLIKSLDNPRYLPLTL